MAEYYDWVVPGGREQPQRTKLISVIYEAVEPHVSTLIGGISHSSDGSTIDLLVKGDRAEVIGLITAKLNDTPISHHLPDQNDPTEYLEVGEPGNTIKVYLPKYVSTKERLVQLMRSLARK